MFLGYGRFTIKGDNTTLVPYTPLANDKLPPAYDLRLANREHNEDYLKIGVLNKIQYPTGGSTEFDYEANAELVSIGGNLTYTPQDAFVATIGQTPDEISSGEHIFLQPFTITNIPALESVSYTSSSDICEFDPDAPSLDCSLFNIYRVISPIERVPMLGPGQIVGTSGTVTLEEGDYLLELRVSESDIVENPDATIRVDLNWIEQDSLQTVYGGGLRVAEIRNYDKDESLQRRRTYEYSGLVTDISPNEFKHKVYGEDEANKFVFSSDVIRLDPLLSRGSYYYQNVTIKEVGDSKEITTRETYSEKYSQENFMGQLAVQEFLGPDGLPLRRRTLDYDIITDTTVQFWVMGDVDVCYAYEGMELLDDRRNELGFNAPISRTFSSRRSELRNELIEDFTTGSSEVFSISTDYTYNEYLMVKSQTTQNSRGSTITSSLNTDYTYPNDHPHLADFVDEDTHLVGLPVSKTIYNNGPQIFGQYSEFDDTGNVIKTYAYNRDATAQINTAPVGYELVGEFKLVEGRPIEVKTLSGVPVTYIWSYNEQYPVAKIENATATQVASELGVSEAVLGDFPLINLSSLDGLRTDLLNARVNTYKYEPLVGLIEVTDPNGLKTNYDYDGLGRLKHILDDDANVLKSIRYKYYTPE